MSQVDPITDQTLFDLMASLNIKSQDLLIVLEELLMNSMEHGNSSPTFFYSTGEVLFFVLRDKGMGIHENIPQNPRLSDTKGKSTTSILRLALEEGITGTGTVGRGMGLFYLSKFVSEHDAEAIVASNQGYIHQNRHQFLEHTTANDTGGTIVILKVKASEVGL